MKAASLQEKASSLTQRAASEQLKASSMTLRAASEQEKAASMQRAPAAVSKIYSSKQEISAVMSKTLPIVAAISWYGAGFRAMQAAARCNAHKKSRIAAALKG